MADEKQEEREEASRRAYGVLATGLGESLRESRDALAAHQELLPQGRLGQIDRLIEEFDRRRVRVAIYGEVKAGKSTLINAIAGRELSPAAFDPLTSVPLRVTYGAETVWRIGDRRLATIDEVAQSMRDADAAATEIVVETPVDLLRLGGQVDLLDTPGVGSEDRADRISAEALRSLDAVVLVVRYPGLFTRVTRAILEDLESDIAKLFVVWNLDADCAELETEERDRHAQDLRRNVAGAHELHLVDARRALRASEQNDESGRLDSGLDAFVAALGRFASSDKREVAALREAAKTAEIWFAEGDRALRARAEELRRDLAAARARLRTVEEAADAERRASEDQFERFRSTLDLLAVERGDAARNAAQLFRRDLRRARRGWIRSGDVEPMKELSAEAAARYVAASRDVGQQFCDAVDGAARELGAQFTERAPVSDAPSIEPLAPEDRLERSRVGRMPMLRRAMWRRWYLPGVSEIERDVIDGELAAAETWAEAVRGRAVPAVRQVVDARVAEVDNRRTGELAEIKAETRFEAQVAELAAVDEHAPEIEAGRGSIADINREARKLYDVG